MNKIKLNIKLVLLFFKDFLKGNTFNFSKKDKNRILFNHSLEFSQEIKPSETFENKCYNLNTASQKINKYVILPNQIFSFWKIVKNPDKIFKSSRSIINGKLVNEIGGGICQVSGIVHYASMLVGLQIIERHNHSIDIYTEETRFSPLGTDATVVFGNKDLRIKNNFDFPIKFELFVKENTISIYVLSTKPLEKKDLFYQITENESSKKVIVSYIDKTIIHQSSYKKMV